MATGKRERLTILLTRFHCAASVHWEREEERRRSHQFILPGGHFSLALQFSLGTVEFSPRIAVGEILFRGC